MVNTNEIVKGCVEKNKLAQYRLYDLYSPKLLGVCLRYTDGRDEAHDVLQETFIRVFEKIGQLKDPNQLEGWLRRVAVSTAVNHYHKNKKHMGSANLDSIMFKVADDTPDILSVMNSKELLELINKMPAGYRLVFNMFAIEGYSHKEIAELANISEGTSKSQLNHAKAWLKQYVSKRSRTEKNGLENESSNLQRCL